MAYSSMWYSTRMSSDLCGMLIKELAGSEVPTMEGKVGHGKAIKNGGSAVDNSIRDSTISWIGEDHWIQGFLWHHIQKANFANWKYDVLGFDKGRLQLTTYGPGQFYKWHRDSDNSSILGANVPRHEHPHPDEELVRKLSISLFLTNEGEDHDGGQFQLMDGLEMNSFSAKRGDIVIFDSTSMHRVRPVKWGRRASIVGWVVGPRWR